MKPKLTYQLRALSKERTLLIVTILAALLASCKTPLSNDQVFTSVDDSNQETSERQAQAVREETDKENKEPAETKEVLPAKTTYAPGSTVVAWISTEGENGRVNSHTIFKVRSDGDLDPISGPTKGLAFASSDGIWHLKTKPISFKEIDCDCYDTYNQKLSQKAVFKKCKKNKIKKNKLTIENKELGKEYTLVNPKSTDWEESSEGETYHILGDTFFYITYDLFNACGRNYEGSRVFHALNLKTGKEVHLEEFPQPDLVAARKALIANPKNRDAEFRDDKPVRLSALMPQYKLNGKPFIVMAYDITNKFPDMGDNSWSNWTSSYFKEEEISWLPDSYRSHISPAPKEVVSFWETEIEKNPPKKIKEGEWVDPAPPLVTRGLSGYIPKK